MSVLFGPNAAGKSNLLDAIQALSRIGTHRTLSEALEGGAIRGYAFEQFAGGVSGFHSGRPESQFSIEADLSLPQDGNRVDDYRYRIEVGITFRSGVLANRGEYLSALAKSGEPKGTPAIDTAEGRIAIRRQSGGGRPRQEELGQSYSVLSDRRFASPAYKFIERVRTELQDWEAYYLDPRVAMRAEVPPMDVSRIGAYGQLIAPFLYKLRGERPKHYDSIARTVRTILPDVPGFEVELDRSGTLDFLFLAARHSALVPDCLRRNAAFAGAVRHQRQSLERLPNRPRGARERRSPASRRTLGQDADLSGARPWPASRSDHPLAPLLRRRAQGSSRP